jgi:hypothetical protein
MSCAFELVRGDVLRDARGSTPRPCASDSACWPRPATPCASRCPARGAGGSAPSGPLPGGTATISPTRRGASAPASRRRGRTHRRVVALGVPRQLQRTRPAARPRRRQVQERRQQLRDGQHRQRGLLAVACAGVDVGERAVRGAEIDADGITRAVHSSTSAGAMTFALWLSASFGRRTSSTRQPRWLMLPTNGARPTTLPVRRIALASKPS